jgi:hypothetical protein
VSRESVPIEQEVFTVKMLRETLEPMPQDMQVWIKVKGYVGGITHIKLVSIHGQGPYLVLRCDP